MYPHNLLSKIAILTPGFFPARVPSVTEERSFPDVSADRVVGQWRYDIRT
jgi:hypothetical protein